MAQNNRPPFVFTQWQKDILPYHVCREGFPGYEDTDVLPQPPKGYGRVLCPNRECRIVLFVPAKAPWIEYPRMIGAQHPLNRNHPAGYGDVIKGEGWWNKRCENCGAWNHTVAVCGQYQVQTLCSFCNVFGHEIDNCRKAINNQRTHKILPYPVGPTILAIKRHTPSKMPKVQQPFEVQANLIDFIEDKTLVPQPARDVDQPCTSRQAITEQQSMANSNKAKYEYEQLSLQSLHQALTKVQEMVMNGNMNNGTNNKAETKPTETPESVPFETQNNRPHTIDTVRTNATLAVQPHDNDTPTIDLTANGEPSETQPTDQAITEWCLKQTRPINKASPEKKRKTDASWLATRSNPTFFEEDEELEQVQYSQKRHASDPYPDPDTDDWNSDFEYENDGDE